MSIAGKSGQIFEHVSCYFRPEDRQICSKVYLIFPATLIDLIIDITFFLAIFAFPNFSEVDMYLPPPTHLC